MVKKLARTQEDLKQRTALVESRKDQIIKLHQEVNFHWKMSIEKAIKIGELLTDQKKDLPHGQWLSWIENNLPFSDQTARNYIRLFEKREDPKFKNVLNLRDAYKLLVDKQDLAQELTDNKFAFDIDDLYMFFEDHNKTYFDKKLEIPTILIENRKGKNTLATYQYKNGHQIRMDTRFFTPEGLKQQRIPEDNKDQYVSDCLLHEMIHQSMNQKGEKDIKSHGEVFKKECDRVADINNNETPYMKIEKNDDLRKYKSWPHNFRNVKVKDFYGIMDDEEEIREKYRFSGVLTLNDVADLLILLDNMNLIIEGFCPEYMKDPFKNVEKIVEKLLPKMTDFEREKLFELRNSKYEISAILQLRKTVVK